MKILLILFYINFCFCTFQQCVKFYDYRTNGTSENYCQLNQDDRSQYKQCLRCRYNADYRMQINRSCVIALKLLCVELDLNDTKTMMNFNPESIKIINSLFDRTNSMNKMIIPMLFVHVDHDTSDELHYENYRIFDVVPNRTYKGLSLELNDRFHRPILKLNSNNKKMTLDVLHINIYCNEKGLYQYAFWIQEATKLKEELKCEIRRSNLVDDLTNENRFIDVIKSNLIVISVCFSLSLLLPCLLIVYCLYLMYQRRNAKLKTTEIETESVQSNETDRSLIDDENLVTSSPPVVQSNER